MNALYDTYEKLYEGLVSYLAETLPKREDEPPTARQGRIDRLAFEDARYVLPLSTLTSLGMTGNGRALRDAIGLLGASSLPEVQHLAAELAEEITKVFPTLLRHASPSEYQLKWCRSWDRLAGSAAQSSTEMPSVQLLRFTGQGTDFPEETAWQIVAQAAVASGVRVEESSESLEAIVSDLGPHDVLPPAFHWVRYDCLFALSEAAWHQLLRHCRGMHFQWGPPEISNGYTVPPSISAAGLTDLFDQAIAVSEGLYRLLAREAPETASYAVINAHRRRVRSEFDLRQLYHLVNLRTTPEAQWDIRHIITQLWDQIRAVHPGLASRAQRRC